MTPIQNIFKCFNLYCALKQIKLEKNRWHIMDEVYTETTQLLEKKAWPTL